MFSVKMSKDRAKKQKFCKSNVPLVHAVKPIPKDHGKETQNENITLPFDVLQMLFKDLLAKDLNNSAMVCRLWQDAAATEIEKRNPVIKMCIWKDAFEIDNSNSHFSNFLTARPMFGLLFGAANTSLPDSLGKYVPQYCVTLLINNGGIVLNAQEDEQAQGNVLMTYLSDDPDIKIEYIIETSKRITHFDRKLNVFHEGARGSSKMKIESIFQDSFDRLKDIKCIIYLASEKSSRGMRCIQVNPLREYSNVLWGGIANSLTICKRNSTKKTQSENINWAAIMISGSNVKSWSIVIDANVNETGKIKEKLMEMKKNVETLRHTVGFMYACVGRGESFYSEKNVESSLFKNVFPNIPLVGCFGGGEFGTTTIGDELDTNNKTHQYSTAFMILTYG